MIITVPEGVWEWYMNFKGSEREAKLLAGRMLVHYPGTRLAMATDGSWNVYLFKKGGHEYAIKSL